MDESSAKGIYLEKNKFAMRWITSLLPVDEDRIDMEKQWELGMAQPNPFKFEQENMRPWLAEFLRNSFVTGQTLLYIGRNRVYSHLRGESCLGQEKELTFFLSETICIRFYRT